MSRLVMGLGCTAQKSTILNRCFFSPVSGVQVQKEFANAPASDSIIFEREKTILTCAFPFIYFKKRDGRKEEWCNCSSIQFEPGRKMTLCKIQLFFFLLPLLLFLFFQAGRGKEGREGGREALKDGLAAIVHFANQEA